MVDVLIVGKKQRFAVIVGSAKNAANARSSLEENLEAWLEMLSLSDQRKLQPNKQQHRNS